MTDQKETQKPVNRRGHNAMVTGATMLVFGILGAIVLPSGDSPMAGLSVFVAVGGLVTWIIGIGMRRETPRS
ncbi:hypothetical protein AOC05_04925 [Arthrobacter alpinus]|uniref:Uncharacterized protein n=1 Tax=Arthrobacter alpinus TaxID=656366 RepID=A0A0M4QP28_9MICC|nr:hypothetical protein AOC05_04925 [Arthrobacter alpinus]